MTKTHATGASMTYGMRYLLKMIFNVAVGEDDNDGNEQRPRGGQDHRYKEPQSKSDRKKEKPPDTEEGEQVPSGSENYPAVKRANADADRVQTSNLKTLQANMKRLKITEAEFAQEFGFPLEQLDKHGLNEVLDWIKEKSEA